MSYVFQAKAGTKHQMSEYERELMQNYFLTFHRLDREYNYGCGDHKDFQLIFLTHLFPKE